MKRRRVNVLAGGVLAILVSACAAPSRIESNKAQSYTAEPRRLFVFTELGAEWGAKFTDAFHARFAAIMADCGTKVQMVRLTPLDLDQKARVEQMKRFGPDAVLSVRRNGGTKDQYGSLTHAVYDSRLTDVKTEAIVWRSNTNFYRGLTLSVEERGEVFAIELTNKLKQDQILRSCTVIAPKS